MKQFMKRSLALLLALIMLVGWMPQLSLPVAAAAEQSVVNYQMGDVSSTYKNVVKNWGTRGELATFLSPMAEAFYEEGFLEEMAALAGSSDTTIVNTSALYAALQELMASNHKKTTGYDATKDMFQYTDIEENGAKSAKISAFYSAVSVGPQWDSGSTWNREHTWPQSKGGNSDIMLLRPESAKINSGRGDKAYGTGDATKFYDPNKQTESAYNLHGDVARVVLYTYVRWGAEVQDVKDKMWGETGVIESLDVLLDWAEEDPVDTWEMARNDSVQSITGTRNVFVDYPELVFELFETAVPEDYVTPSGSANDAAITVTAVVEGEGGAVSVNGEYVTVHPYAGYQVATVTGADQIKGDVYAVTSQEDCTVTVTFKKAANYMVNVWENGKRVSHAVVEDGNGFELPAFSGTVPEGHAFNGWVKAEAADSANKPAEIYEAGQDMIITGDSDFYALMTYLDPNDMSNPGKSWKLVTSAADLVLGDSYIIAGSNTAMAMSQVQKTNNRDGVTVTKAEDKSTLSFTDDVTIAELTLTEGIEIEVTEPETTAPPETPDGFHWETSYDLVTDASSLKVGDKVVIAAANSDQAMSTTQNGNNRGQTAITKDGNKLTSVPTDVQIVTLEQGTTDGTFAFNVGTGYLYAAASGNNYLKTKSSIDVHGSWKITVTDGVASITAPGSSNRNVMQYNSSSSLFACYGSASQAKLALYKVTEVLTEDTVEPETPETETTEPAGPVSGYVKVTDKSEFVTGNYVMVVSSGYAPTKYDSASSGWLLSAKPTVTDGMVTEANANGYVWTLTVNGSNVTIKDSNGKFIKPKSGNNNGIQTGEYSWAWEFANGAFKFKGTGSDTTTLASNTGSSNKFRSYKNTTVTGSGYYSTFTLYKWVDGTAAAAEKTVKMEQKGNVIETIKTYAFYDPANNGYLFAAASGNNHLKTQSTLDLNGSWLITVAADGACTIVAQGANTTNKLQFNANDKLFSCYTSSQESVALYHGIAGAGTRHYTTIWGDRTCLHLEHKTEVVEPTLTAGGYTKVLCVACGEELYTKDEVPALGYVDSWSLTLGDDIGVNFRFAIDDSIRDTAKVSITVGSDKPVVFNVADLAVEDGYMVTVPAAASQMQDEIKVQIVNGEDATEVKTYTIEGYARDVLAKEEFSQYHQVLKDMLNYGAAAQIYFQHNHEGTLPNADIEGIGNAEIPNEAVTQQIATGIVDGISFYAASLVHKERIAVRLYFKLASGNIEDYTFCTSVSDPESVKTPVCKDAEAGLYYIEFAGINPDELNNAVSIYVVKGKQSFFVQYSPLDYMIRMNNKETSSAELKAMLKALYNYYLAAKEI